MQVTIDIVASQWTAYGPLLSRRLLFCSKWGAIDSHAKRSTCLQANVAFWLPQLTVNIVAVTTACIGAIAVQESPLTAVQMLWLNLIMDSLASLALATEAPTDAMLDLPPYSAQQSLLTPTVSACSVMPLLFCFALRFWVCFSFLCSSCLLLDPCNWSTPGCNATPASLFDITVTACTHSKGLLPMVCFLSSGCLLHGPCHRGLTDVLCDLLHSCNTTVLHPW